MDLIRSYNTQTFTNLFDWADGGELPPAISRRSFSEDDLKALNDACSIGTTVQQFLAIALHSEMGEDGIMELVDLVTEHCC